MTSGQPQISPYWPFPVQALSGFTPFRSRSSQTYAASLTTSTSTPLAVRTRPRSCASSNSTVNLGLPQRVHVQSASSSTSLPLFIGIVIPFSLPSTTVANAMIVWQFLSLGYLLRHCQFHPIPQSLLVLGVTSLTVPVVSMRGRCPLQYLSSPPPSCVSFTLL